MTENTTSQALPKFFDKDPALKKRMQDFLATVSEEEKRKSVEIMDRFMRGEISWAEVKNIPQKLLKYLAQVAYQFYKSADYAKAEILFKGLAILDHRNWYYRSALGAVYQKQNLFEQAIAEFDIALEINPKELTSLVNRGQCYLKLHDTEAALTDFNRVLALPLEGVNPWVKRTHALIQSIVAHQGKKEG